MTIEYRTKKARPLWCAFFCAVHMNICSYVQLFFGSVLRFKTYERMNNYSYVFVGLFFVSMVNRANNTDARIYTRKKRVKVSFFDFIRLHDNFIIEG